MKTLRNILLLSTLILLASCSKMGDNDQVSGFWQLVSVNDGTNTTDVTSDKIFWGMQNGIISIRNFTQPFQSTDGEEPCIELVGTYTFNGKRLVIGQTFYHYDSHDVPMDNFSDALKVFGITIIGKQFDIGRKGQELSLYDGKTTFILDKR